MTVQLSVIVYFDCDHIPECRRYDPSTREQVLNEGLSELRRAFPHVTFGQKFVSGCAVGVSVSEDEFLELMDYLEKTRIGSFEFEGAMFQGANELGQSDRLG